jgi:DNA-binding CsgD family transcriptional regulator
MLAYGETSDSRGSRGSRFRNGLMTDLSMETHLPAGGDNDARGLVRTAEWSRVREFTSGAPSRAAPSLLAVTGEAGAGKSTLWRAGLEVATGAGGRVLRSEPSAGEADASFAGLSDLLADILPAVAGDIPGPQREALEVALLLRPAGDQPSSAHAVGLAVLAALRSALAAGPVLLAIDDVQWLDAGSLDALTFALRRVSAGPLAVLLAARAEAPADPLTFGAPPVPHGWRDLLTAVPAPESVTLAPLDPWQVHKLLPPEVTAAQARLVARQSRGNPFWAREIWASLDAAEAPVPPLAKGLTGRLSRSLTPEAAEALAMVAAAGRIGTRDALAVLRHHDDPATALDEAVLAGLVVEKAGRLAAAHPLIGAAAVESMPPLRRAQLYRRLAAAAASPERHAHFAALAAGPGPDPEVAAALDAAAAAAHARAGSAAAGQFAAQAVAFTPAADTEALARRRIRAGELLFLAGELAQSLSQLEALDTADLATAGLDTADLERALPMLADVTDLLRGPEPAIARVTRWVASAGTEPRRRALVLALASDTAYGLPGGRRAAAQDAIACALAAGPAANASRHRALLNLVIAKVTGGDGLDRDLLAQAEELEPGLPPGPLHDTADLNRGLWARFVEDLDTARAALRRCIARASEAGEDYPLVTFLCYLAATEELAGAYRAGEEAIAAAQQTAAWHDWPPSPWHLEPRCDLLIAAGRLDEALALADEHLPDGPDEPASTAFVGACVRGKVSFWRGDAEAAIPHLERARACAEQLEWTDPGCRSRLDSLLAEACLSGGRPEEASRIAAWLGDTGRRMGRPTLTGDGARLEALIAAVAGDLEAAVAAARTAVAAHESSPVRAELARSLLVLGQVERRRKARGEARAALRRAAGLAAELGHRPLLDRIERELPRAVAARPDGELTAAEQRVADQIAGGATSREAAAALFVSVRTVETHVAAIYRKLGIRTRSELRRALAARSDR